MAARDPGRDLERFVVDFDGAYLSKQGRPLIEPLVTVGEALSS